MSGEINTLICTQGNVRAGLEPPYINNAIRTVVGADVGAGINQLAHGLYVIFERWPMTSVGDIFEFYMGDVVPIAMGEVLAGQLNQPRFYLQILDEIPTDFTRPCYGVVRRAGGGDVDTSIVQTWFIRTDRPGGVDTDPGVPYHTELKFSLPLDLQGPDAELTTDRANQGVICTIKPYPNIRIRDKVVLEWDQKSPMVELKLDDDHLNGNKPIEVFVPPHVILEAGSGLLAIRFRVFDEVNNGSGPTYPWSQSTHLKSDLDPALLERPYFLINGVDYADVDLDTQGAGPFEIEVFTPQFLPDGTRTPVDTQIVVTFSPTRELPPVDARIGRSTFISVDKAFVEELLNSSTNITYSLQFPLGNDIGRSRQLRLTVTGTASNLPPVRVVQSQGGVIDPQEPFIRVEFPDYEPYDASYNVTLVIEDETGQVDAFEQNRLAGPPPPPTRFRIVTDAEYEPFVGRSNVSVYYRVDDGKPGITEPSAVRESVRLPVQFGTVFPDLLAPLIAMTDEHDNLDPAVLIGRATVTLPYVMTLVGDKVTWTWIGSGTGGSTGGEITLNSGTAGRPLEFDVDRTYVDKNLSGEIRLSYFIEREGSPILRSAILRVTVGPGLGELLRPEVWEASRNPDELAPEAVTAGATIVVSYLRMLPTDQIRARWKGLPGIGSFSEIKNGNSQGRVEFLVPAEVVGVNIHRLGRDVSVQYDVLRGGRETPSPVLSLLLLPIVHLPTPILDIAGENQVLELFKLDGLERTRMNTWPFVHALQYMWLEYMGTFRDGSSYFEARYDGNLVGEEVATNGVSVAAPVDKLLDLLDGSDLSILFYANFGRNPDRESAVLFGVRNYLIQELPQELPYPTVVYAVGSDSLVTLDSLNAQNGGQIIVAYTPMSTQHQITLVLEGTEGAGSFTITLPGEVDGSVAFAVPASVIAANIGNGTTRFTVQYHVATGAGDSIPSGVVTVMLTPLTAAHRPPVIINQADPVTKVLELSRVISGAMVRASTWPFIAAHQPVYLKLKGTRADGQPHNYQVWALESDVVTQQWVTNGFFEAAVPASYFKDLKHGSTLTTVFRVSLASSPAFDREVIDFQQEVYSVSDVTERPVIIYARDDRDNLIVDGGYTVAVAVTLSGTAAPGRDVDIFDGSVRKGTARADNNGVWQLRLTGLSQGLRRFTARALYGDLPISAQYSMTILNSVTPTIAVFDSKGEVTHNGTTFDTQVTLRGVATPRLKVQLYEDGSPSVVLPVNLTGEWSLIRSNLAQRTYSFKVRALYDNLESTTRSFTVDRTVPFSFNTTTVVRDQRLYLWAGLGTNPAFRPQHNLDTFQHRASGGREPYTYASSNPACAVVDSTGAVVIRNNGSTRITCRDAQGTTLGYDVQVRNVAFFRDYGGGGGYKECLKQAASRGGRLPSLNELRGIYAQHGGSGRWQGQAHNLFWSTDSSGFLARWGKSIYNGGEASMSELGNRLTMVMF
ncbi:hypothetical protein [Pseudomonas sp. W4I3]|uniref:hypothetical protein n=1 Tax=Pseudomonas sp. W4I3 TaxID=3042294 RepID=UPI0027871BAE|nr:hypothetical protein [Pseudomonas sp. W4I3]MDQ0740861.1 hypothetical protein [Pseudomonas sp. W4I3]